MGNLSNGIQGPVLHLRWNARGNHRHRQTKTLMNSHKFIWFHCMREVADKTWLGKVAGLQDLFVPCTGKGCLLMSVSPSTNTSLPMVTRQFIDTTPAPCVVIICCWLSSPEAQIPPTLDTEQRQLGWEQCHLTLSRQVEEVPREKQQQLLNSLLLEMPLILRQRQKQPVVTTLLT